MKQFFRSFTQPSKFAAVAALVSILPIANQPALAQQVPATSEATEEVKVVAPEAVQQTIVGRTTIGAPIEVISLSRPVSYADLDLTKQSDVKELAERIEETAKASCKQLDNMYPDSSLYVPIPSDQYCVKTATSQAIDEANQVIAAANQTARR